MTSPVTVQSDFRLRNDDGSQTTATWVANQNANASLLADKNYRVRFNIRETNNRAFTLDAQLEYNKGGAGWNAVNASSSNVRTFASANFADGDATTEQLAGAGTFTAGKMEEADGLISAIALQNNDTEVEFCFQIRSADVASGNTIQLRVTDAGTALTTYSQTPTITVLQAYTITAEQGSYALSGQAVNLLYGHKLVAEQGSYTLNGQAVTFAKGYIFTADQGSYALAGQAVNFPRTYVLAAGQGSYALSGQSVNLLYGRLLTAEQGSYALSGQAAGLYRGYPLSIGQGTYTLSGQAVNLLYGRVLGAGQGSYTLTGQSVNLLYGRKLAAGHGVYTLTGQDAGLIYTPVGAFTLTAETGQYTLVGQTATFAYVVPANTGGINPVWPLYFPRLVCGADPIVAPEEWGLATAEISNETEAAAFAEPELWGVADAQELVPPECVMDAIDEDEEVWLWRGARQPLVKDMLLALLAARRENHERSSRARRA